MTDERDELDSWIDAAVNHPHLQAGRAVLLNRADLDQHDCFTEVLEHAAGRGWHVIESGNDLVIFPHAAAIRQLC